MWELLGGKALCYVTRKIIPWLFCYETQTVDMNTYLSVYTNTVLGWHSCKGPRLIYKIISQNIYKILYNSVSNRKIFKSVNGYKIKVLKNN